MLIDQKRAHERVLFERFKDCLSNNRAVSQVDMFPVTTELNPADYFILKEIEGELELLGFRIQHSGKNKITINGKPSGSESSDPLEMLEILLEDYKTTQEVSIGQCKRQTGISNGSSLCNTLWQGTHSGRNGGSV